MSETYYQRRMREIAEQALGRPVRPEDADVDPLDKSTWPLELVDNLDNVEKALSGGRQK